MEQRFKTFFMLAVVAAAATACGSAPDAAPPVATPSLRLSSPDVPVGGPVELTYRFDVAANAPAFAEDYSVFVHFLDSDGELLWTDDHLPPTPTRQWKPGSSVEYTRTIFAPTFPYVGEASVNLGLYLPSTGARLPLSGESEGQREYRVASLNLRPQTDNVLVVFREGWYDTETTPDGQQWQWSKREATFTFRNPKRDIEFLLQLDQPIGALAEPRQVEVRLGAAAIDTFMLPAGKPELRRLAITAEQLGQADTVEMGISVDKTFVPASEPGLRSSDVRELGVRVFRAFVRPK